MISIKHASEKLGIHPQTLRRWEEEGRINPVRTAKGQRRYNIADIELLANGAFKRRIIYIRIDQDGNDRELEQQYEFVKYFFPNYEVVRDKAGSSDYDRQGLREILEQLYARNVEQIIVPDKSRLFIGPEYSLFERIAKDFGCEIISFDNSKFTYEREQLECFREIAEHFSKISYGIRSIKTKIQDHLHTYQEEISVDL